MTWSPPDFPRCLPLHTGRRTVKNSHRCQRGGCFPGWSISQPLEHVLRKTKKNSAVLNNTCLFKWIFKHSDKPCPNPCTRSNSAGQGKQLLLQVGRSSFSQDLFLWLNYFYSEFGLLFYSFCINFPSLCGESCQLVAHLLSKCSLFTAVWE